MVIGSLKGWEGKWFMFIKNQKQILYKFLEIFLQIYNCHILTE
jgi:hypothetical protein